MYPNDIIIIDIKDWCPGKSDHTEFSYSDNVIRVRSDYDWVIDPHKWIVHERVHKKLLDFGVDDTSNYPNNVVEKFAFITQFKALRKDGYNLPEVI